MFSPPSLDLNHNQSVTLPMRVVERAEEYRKGLRVSLSIPKIDPAMQPPSWNRDETVKKADSMSYKPFGKVAKNGTGTNTNTNTNTKTVRAGPLEPLDEVSKSKIPNKKEKTGGRPASKSLKATGKVARATKSTSRPASSSEALKDEECTFTSTKTVKVSTLTNKPFSVTTPLPSPQHESLITSTSLKGSIPFLFFAISSFKPVAVSS
ncbi:hypothetical protein BJ742DRAFT_774791 [Cladochytrium replicatum]|nr:hypothetical protein BJ742DRAFT_774791 [Cladochytrium replicatum]